MLVPVQNDQFVSAASNIGTPPDPQPEKSPDFATVAGAAFRQENLIGSFMARQDMGDNTPEDGYDFTTDVVGTKYEPYIDRFATRTFNKNQKTALMRQIDMEEEDRNTIRAGGWMGMLSSIGAGVFSPENLIPFGGEAYRGARVGLTATSFAKEFAMVGALGAGVSELGLRSTQEIRPGSDTAFAIGGGALLGGILGGSIGAVIGRQEMGRIAAEVDRFANSAAPDMQRMTADQLNGMIASAGAAAVKRDTLQDLTVAGKAASAAAKSTAPLNPILRALDSPSVVYRRHALGLMENPIYLRKNFEGGASEAAVESLVKEYSQGRLATAVEQMSEIYKDYRKAGGSLKIDAFRDEVGRAMRRSDLNEDPHIQKAAGIWRAEVFDPLKEKAIEVGLLPKDVSVETASSYFSRVYNRPKIEANEGAFKAIVSQWLDGEITKVERAAAKAEKAAENIPDFVNAADRQSYIKEIADDIFNTITGRNADGDLPRDIVAAKRGPLKERTFNIPDAMIEDFLESDVEAVGRRYSRMMAADVELQGKYGSTTLEPQLKEVRDDYKAMREAVTADRKATKAQKDKRIAILNAREKGDIRDMKAVRDMLRGTYMARENSSNFARVAAAAGTLNYLRAMGGVVLSSATDVARHVMVHGMTNVMQDGIKPLITNLKAFRMSASEAKRAGAVAERVLQTRMATWGEIIDPYSQNSPFERFLRNTATGFSHLTGMGYWNEFQKQFASVLTQARILRGASDFAKVKPREKAYLAFLGIDEDMAARIAKQFSEHGTTEDGIRVAHSDDWTDEIARRAYRAAINKDVDSTIVSKGVGDVPLFAHTPTGRMLIQFKSFALASHQRAFIRGMQEAPAGMISGTIMATTIGMMIYYLKAIEANRVEDISDNPGRWIAEGLDRSGMFAVAFEANNTIEKALGIGAYGALQSLFPDSSQGGKASRYMTRSTAAALTGPTGDFIDTLVKVTQGAMDGDLKESDVNAIRRLAPFATLPGIRSLVEYMVMPAARQAVAN